MGSKSKVPEGAKIAQVDYDNEETLVEALKGQQFLAISMATRAPKDTQAKIIKAAAKAGVPWIMPNCYGVDFTNKPMATDNMTGPNVWAGIQAVEDTGVCSWITMACSYWYEFSLAAGQEWYGFDFANKKATFYDDGKTAITTSTWAQCGRALAALLSLKELPEDENDTSPNISQWKNSGLFISSFFLSQREMLDSVQRVTGTTDKDWKIEYEPSDVRWRRGKELMEQGNMLGYAMAMYARTFYPNGDGDLKLRHTLANEVLGLPEEDLAEATKRGLKMVDEGYNYFARG